MPADPLQTVFKRHLFSHYAYSGATVSVGVAAVSLLGYLLFGANFFALTFGALCVSITDVPTPARHKRVETFSGLVFATLTTYVVASAQGSTLHTGLAILGTSFFAALMTVYGRKALPLSFAMFMAMVLAMILPLQGTAAVWQHTGRFALGGGLYAAYATLIALRLNFRTRQQALGECVQALADFMTAQARLLDTDVEPNRADGDLIARQVVVAEKLQVARDLVFRHLRTPRDGMLAATLVEALNLFEHLLSAQTGYGALIDLARVRLKSVRAEPVEASAPCNTLSTCPSPDRGANGVATSPCPFNSTAPASQSSDDLLLFLRDIALKGAQDLEHIGYTLLRGEARYMEVNYKAELYAIEHELEGLRARQPASADALAAALEAFAQAQRGIAQICRLRAASDTPVEPHRAVDGLSIDPFLTRPSFRPGLLLANLHLRSPVFRYALRIALAMSLGYGVDLVLPYTSHGYWILLTIAVVMRSSFSLTRSRYWDRVAGNLIGCVLAALLLWVTQNPVVILLVLFSAIGISHAYANVKFRVTAVASCLMGLLPAHFIDPGASHLVTERLLDTLVGAAIAYGFSFVLPNWERSALPRLAEELVDACAAYAELALQRTPNLLNYRLARKHAIDAITALGQASQRMRDEPEQQHGALAQINPLLTASHLLAAQLASIHIVLEQGAMDSDPSSHLTELAATVRRTLQGETAGSADTDPAADALLGTSTLAARLASIHQAATTMGRLAAQVKAG